VTGEPPCDRLERERPLLGRLPRVRYDTARREPRRVGRVPLVEVDGARYSVPPELAGQLVEARLPVASSMLEVRSGGQLVASHTLAAAGQTAWDPAHRAALERQALGRRRPARHLRAVTDPLPPCTAELELGPGDYQVATPTWRCAMTSTAVSAHDWAVSHDPSGLYEQLKDDLGSSSSPGGRAAAHPARPGPRGAAQPRRLSRRAGGRRGRGHPQPQDGRTAALCPLPGPAHHRGVRLRVPASVDRGLVDDLASLRFVTEGRPLLLLGQPGCGKSHLAIALATLAIEAGYRGYFTSAADLVASLTTAYADGSFGHKIRTYTGPSVLVIDDVGLTPGPGRRQRAVPGRQPPLRQPLDHHRHHQPRAARLGRAVRRPGGRRGHPGPAAPPGGRHQHQGSELAPARAPATGRPRARGVAARI
jgi:IstB-like ATP binding protein